MLVGIAVFRSLCAGIMLVRMRDHILYIHVPWIDIPNSSKLAAFLFGKYFFIRSHYISIISCRLFVAISTRFILRHTI